MFEGNSRPEDVAAGCDYLLSMCSNPPHSSRHPEPFTEQGKVSRVIKPKDSRFLSVGGTRQWTTRLDDRREKQVEALDPNGQCPGAHPLVYFLCPTLNTPEPDGIQPLSNSGQKLMDEPDHCDLFSVGPLP